MRFKSAAVISIMFCFIISPVMAGEKKQPVTEKEKISYGIGLSLGRDFKQKSIEVDPQMLMLGVEDAIQENQPALTDEQIREAINSLQAKLAAQKQQQDQELADKNLLAGSLFLEENKKKKNVVVLSSGLQYEILREGKGAIPKPEDIVVANYEGTLIDGTVFDSSYKRGQPAEFAVNRVIMGWTEALQLMNTGAKWKLYIPPNLAYGPKSAGPVIGPNSTLIFEVELLEIKTQ
ncbi:FKBP-type peptidyl-prolyl cis-trans isomerase [bacterium]|nr:FKBP-type peptidyl-prolyl cis-trans isomerase [bacterium]